MFEYDELVDILSSEWFYVILVLLCLIAAGVFVFLNRKKTNPSNGSVSPLQS